MAVDFFLEIDGVKGKSRDAKHKEAIDVLAWSWGMSNSGSAHVGGGAGSGKVHVQDISCTKYIDASSNALALAVCNGKHFAKALLTCRKAGGDNPVEYLKITMEDVLISSYQTGGSGGEDRLTENLALNFAKVKFEYTPQDAKGAAGAVKAMGWNIAENVKF